MATIATLATSLTAKTTNFEKGFKKAKRIAANFSSDIARHTRTIAAYGAATIGVAAYATSRLVKEQLSAIDATSKLSRVVGLTTEELVGYQHAMKLAGGDSEGFQKSVVKMNRTIADAGNGLATAKRELEATGLSLSDFANKSTDERIKMLADRYNSIGDAAKRSSFLLNVFGRSGLAMGTLFEQGAEGIRKAQKEAADLNMTFSSIDGRMVEEANDAFGKIGESISAIAKKLAIQLAPFIKVVADRFTAFAQSVDTNGNVVGNVIDWMARKVQTLANLFNLLKAGWNVFVAVVSNSAGALLQPVRLLVKAWNRALEFLGVETDRNIERFLGDMTSGLADQAIDAAEQATQAWDRFKEGFSGDQAKSFFDGIKAEAAKFKDDLASNLGVPGIDGESGAVSGKTSEFRQVDLSRVAIGGVGGSTMSKGETKIVEEQRKTNSLLSVISTRRGILV